MVQRTVRFYVITDEQRRLLPGDLPFDDLRDVVRALDDDDAYVQLARMEVLGSVHEPSSTRRSTPLIALDKIERDVRLRIERKRNYRPLILGKDETLAEPCFYAIFRDNVLGVMRNSGAAPGPASFRDYVNQLELLTRPIDVRPLADQNKVRALADVETLTRMDIAVGPDVNAAIFGNQSFLGDVIDTARQQLGHVSVEVTVKVSPRAHESAEAAFNELERAVNSVDKELLEKAQMTYKSIDTGRSATYDFIDEAVVTSVDVELDPDSSKPTEPSAAEALACAYDQAYDDIMSALRGMREG